MDYIERLEKRISEMECTKDQLEKQRTIIMNLENKRRRKERTRQLIQMGALAEKYFDIHDVADFEDFLRKRNDDNTNIDNKV